MIQFPQIKWPKRLTPNGITQRWFFYNILILLAIVIIVVSAYSFSVMSYYFSAVKTDLENKARTATSFFTTYITKTYAEYYDSAYKYVESFDDAGNLELQVINISGSVEISTGGLTAGAQPNTPDIQDAISNKAIASWIGRNTGTGERIMAVSAPLIYSDGQVIGVMRYVTSLKNVDHEVMTKVAVACGSGLAAMVVIVVINMMFIRSVVDPLKEITQMVRRIADGSYGIQIGQKYKDELGEMTDAINEMSIKVSQSEKMQMEFVSSVSHELRTPLTAITGWGETLVYDEKLDRETKRGIGIILKEARRLTKMVEELLEFTRMQDGRFTLNIEKIDVGAELEDSIFTYKELLKQDDIELIYEPYMDDLPIIFGDPERLRQVFLNILDNAAKYARDGKRIVVRIDAGTKYVSISIRDFGPGVPEDELENVKMKFYKGNSKERGSGIGLAVCDEIIKYHDGKLVLSNAEGGGLLVTIKLPINDDL